MKKALISCVALTISALTNISCGQLASAMAKPVTKDAFRLDDLLKPRGFIPEKAPGKTFGSLDADRNASIPISNQRWFRGRNRIEASVLTFPSEAKARRFDESYVRSHSLPPVSPFSVAPINGVRDNQKSVPKNVTLIDNLIAVGRVYIVIEAIRDDRSPSAAFSPIEFARLVQSVKSQFIARAKAAAAK